MRGRLRTWRARAACASYCGPNVAARQMKSIPRSGVQAIVVLVVSESETPLSYLARAKGIRATACQPAEAATTLATLRPAVVVIDLGSPTGAGLRLVVESTSGDPPVPVVVVASNVRPEVARLVIGAGARAFLGEDEQRALLVPAIHAVAAGGVVLSPRVAQAIAEGQISEGESDGGFHLTRREQSVLEHLSRGLTYEEVAEALGVTANTVRTHVRSLYDKLEATSRTEALNTAMRRRLLRPPT